MKHIGIAILGCGTVGGAVAKRLFEDRDMLARKTGLDLELLYLVDINKPQFDRLGLPGHLFETDINKAIADPGVHIMVELMGGTTLAKDFTLRMLQGGKHVVTANKALLAHHGKELFAAARAKGVTISFEASCGGGIPIIRALYDGVVSNRIDAFYGIVNGTCNYILTEMIQKGKSYANALKDAQEEGLAEADPTLDVTGGDSAHKLAILASLAFRRHVQLSDIPVEGIDKLSLMDVQFGAELGYVVKLLAIARREDAGLALQVRPAFIGTDHPLAWVNGPFNAVSVYGHSVGHTMYYGRGAGGSPTASAIISDIISTGSGAMKIMFDTLSIWPDLTPAAVYMAAGELHGRFYIRCMANDEPGVLAKITRILGDHAISISSFLQQEPQDDQPESIPLVITTHSAREGDVENALKEISDLPVVTGKPVCITIVDEHEEQI
ncbi:MAG: homoserine dehydrogenase [Spirochaetales bacterium]|nr:homoserine dehydrogenase [Spirochaetales bacterium]